MRTYFESLNWLVQSNNLKLKEENNLLINGVLDPLLKDLEIEQVVQRNYVEYKRLKSSGYKVKPEIDGHEKFNNIIIFAEKYKELNLYYLSLAYELSENRIILIALNSLGGKSFIKYGLDLIGNGEKFSKNHCTILVANIGSSCNEKLLTDFRNLGNEKILENGYCTTAGVFSYRNIDSGSKLIVDKIDNLSGVGADLGAGWGYISSEIIRKFENIKYIDLYEIDFIAHRLSKKNIANRANFFWQSAIDIDLENYYDFVVMNPPFHAGEKQNINLGLEFIKIAHKILKKDGKLWVVANRHLPYEMDLRKLFEKLELIENGLEFKVYLAKK